MKVIKMANCQQQAIFRYTWPGRNESFACLEHATQLSRVADAMGLSLQLIPLSGEEQSRVSCSSEEKKK
jgi:hypothetical protein